MTYPTYNRNTAWNIDEEQFKIDVIKYLKNNNWEIIEEFWDRYFLKRLDLVIYRKDCDAYIGLELKLNDDFKNITEGLVQLIEYTNMDWPKKIKIFAIMTPDKLDEATERFYWRFGFGTASLKVFKFLNLEMSCVDGTNKYRIFFNEKLPPYNSNTPEKINEIALKNQARWLSLDLGQPISPIIRG